MIRETICPQNPSHVWNKTRDDKKGVNSECQIPQRLENVSAPRQRDARNKCRSVIKTIPQGSRGEFRRWWFGTHHAVQWLKTMCYDVRANALHGCIQHAIQSVMSREVDIRTKCPEYIPRKVAVKFKRIWRVIRVEDRSAWLRGAYKRMISLKFLCQSQYCHWMNRSDHK
jgi:hypothetical protein